MNISNNIFSNYSSLSAPTHDERIYRESTIQRRSIDLNVSYQMS